MLAPRHWLCQIQVSRQGILSTMHSIQIVSATPDHWTCPLFSKCRLVVSKGCERVGNQKLQPRAAAKMHCPSCQNRGPPATKFSIAKELWSPLITIRTSSRDHCVHKSSRLWYTADTTTFMNSNLIRCGRSRSRTIRSD